MKIAYNPLSSPALATAPAGSDITFDLPGISIYAKGVRFKGTDTTYNVFKKHTSSGSGGYNGLVPVPSYTATNIRFLREDGAWSVPAAAAFIYTQLTNQNLDDYLDEGKWYYAGGGNSTTNKPSGVDAYELYVGRNAIGYRYLKLITLDGKIWFRFYNSSAWKTWVRWYTDMNTDQKVLLSATTTSNFRPLVLGYTNTNTPADLSASTTLLVYTTTTIYAQPSTGSLWANKLYSGGKLVLTEHQSLANYVTLNTAQTITGVKTFNTGCLQVSGSNNYTNMLLSKNTSIGASLRDNIWRIYHSNGSVTDRGISIWSYGTGINNLVLSISAYNIGSTLASPGSAVNSLYMRGIIRATSTITGSGFIRNNSSDSYVLLGGGGHKALSTMESEYDTRYVTLTTNQTVSGIKTFSTLLKFTVATGTSPFTVSSTTVVGNLNADMVDGYHSSKLFRSFGGVSIDFNFSDNNNNNGLYYLHSSYTLSNKNGITYGSLMNFSSSTSSWLIISGGNDARLYYRNRWWSGGGGAWSAWKTIAYTSDIPSSLKNPYSLTLQTNGSTLTTYDGSSAKTFNVTVLNAGSGLLHNSLTITLANTTTDSGWSMINSSYNGFILKSIRTLASTPSWILGDYSAGICFGGADTKGVISCAYSTPSIRFAGGNSSKPVWWMGITGSSGVTYNLANMWTGTRYWANVAVSTASSTGTSPTFNTCYTSNWFRSIGSTGWYSESYGGGWYMTDSTWIRTYGSKSVYQNTGLIRTDGYLVTNGGITVGATSPNNDTYKSHVTGNSWSSGYIRAGAGFYHNSVNSNSYVLLAGGGYKIIDGVVPGQIISLYTTSYISNLFVSTANGARGKSNALVVVSGTTYTVDLSKFILLSFTEECALGVAPSNWGTSYESGSNYHKITNYEMPAHRHYMGTIIAQWGDNATNRNFVDFLGNAVPDNDYGGDPSRFFTRYAGAGISDNVYSWNVGSLGKNKDTNGDLDMRLKTYYAVTMVYKP